MASSSSSGKPAKEGPLEIAGMVAAVLAVMIGLIWIAASNKIVIGTTPMLRGIGSAWAWLPGEVGVKTAVSIYADARRFMAAPAEVGFFAFMDFVNRAVAPLTLFLTLACTTWFGFSIFKSPPSVRRKFSNADDLLREISRVFTGVAPILHIRKDIATHKDVLWARQKFPEEILLTEKVHGAPLITGKSKGPPSTWTLHLDRVEEWLKGLPPEGARRPGRQVSTQLGPQLVNLGDPSDRALFKRPDGAAQAHSFADRMSDSGKAIFGMLTAHAFGGEQGVKDAYLARDQLNNSCRGSAHGMPNLTVAQWIFEKYRANDLAHKLFAVHHWEHTYLFELFIQAKRRGKFTDGEFRWLKPTNRSLWYSLNTVGRFVAHAESAATFNHHQFERKCARKKTWPVKLRDDGTLEHVIFVAGAVAGFKLEWERWRDGTDESDNEWWKENDKSIWSAPNDALLGAMSPPPPPPPGEAADQMLKTSFDDAEGRSRAAAAKRAEDEDRKNFGAIFDK